MNNCCNMQQMYTFGRILNVFCRNMPTTMACWNTLGRVCTATGMTHGVRGLSCVNLRSVRGQRAAKVYQR